MSSQFLRTILLVMAFALLALVIAVSFGAAWGWGVFCAMLAGLLVYHILHLDLLINWASRALSESVPEGSGIWREVFTLLYRRQRAEARQRMRLARMLVRSRQAGRALPYGLAILDADYRIDWCNDSSEEHFEIALEKDARQPITNLVRQPEFVAYVSAKDFSKPLEMKSARVNGPILSVQLVPYVELRWLLISRDITEAAKLRDMRRDFVANVSHELRTPLTVLVGFLETIRELGHEPERSREYLDLMAEQGRRMQRIIDDLLALSTLESAPEPRRDERVDVRELLERTRVAAEALSGGRHRVTLDAD
jgi:two-component system phosphate regulon sensor histidine kinase PhoR